MYEFQTVATSWNPTAKIFWIESKIYVVDMPFCDIVWYDLYNDETIIFWISFYGPKIF